jgi:hypothetical protein
MLLSLLLSLSASMVGAGAISYVIDIEWIWAMKVGAFWVGMRFSPSAAGRLREPEHREIPLPAHRYGQAASGGSDIRIASTLPPVFRPNAVPRS